MKLLYCLLFCVNSAATLAILQPQILADQPQTPIENLAKSIAVYIDGKNHGSGVIIHHHGNLYTVLSAAHVFNPKNQYKIVTSDYKSHPITKTPVKLFPNIDLATAQFASNQNYPTVQLGNSTQVARGNPFYIAGYTANPSSSTPTYHFTKGQIEANASHPIDQGYALAFYSKTYPGMSGGPVLDGQGHLIGIQGFSLVPPAQARSINPLGDLSDRFYMAIPINTFVELNSLRTIKPVPSLQTLSADDYFVQGNLQYTKGNPITALNHYSNAIRLAPDYASAYYGRANLRTETGQTEGALSDYTQALQLKPSYTQAYYYRGSIYANLGRFESAMADYEQALRLNPNFAVVYNNRGTVRFRLGDIKGAIVDYDRALQKNPNLRDAYNNRGLARHRLGDLKRAINDYDRAIQLDPTRASIYINRGLVYSAFGDKAAARIDLQKSADLYHGQGNQVRYQEVIEQIRQMNK
jgi:tetratricopeptide (TPR) repeat protein